MFDIAPDDIAGFDGKQTVELLRRLVYAEAKTAGVALFNVAAPMQITLADGGADALIQWTGGRDGTDYFPHRDVIFQCKASDGGNAPWKKETWTKSTQARGKTRVLNEALTAGISRGAAYIGVTTAGLVGAKPAARAAAIADGIREAGQDPARLAAIELYDGNRLAAWASGHEAVALWIKEQQVGMTLRAFSTAGRWAGREGDEAPAYVQGKAARFEIGSTSGSGLTFEQFSARIVAHLSDPDARSVRVTGSSGVGKSRGVFEGLQRIGLGQHPTASSVIFCDRRETGDKIWEVASALADRRTPIILFVDECPRSDALQLHKLASAAGSELRVITIDTDPQALGQSGCLDIRVQATDADVISGILAGMLPKATQAERRFIGDLCDGFPSIAVLAARAHEKGDIFQSVADVASRILRGARLTDPDKRRALACLSLFDRLAPEHPAADFNLVAQRLGRMDGDAMYDHLIDAVEPGLVGRYGRDLMAQPRPIANYLALHRLERLRPSVVHQFLEEASGAHRASMLSRVRHLSRSSTLRDVVYLLFRDDGSFGSKEQILSARGSELVDAFVHVDPAEVSRRLWFAIHDASLDELAATKGDIRGIISALRRLVFRQATFRTALWSLLRLAAAEQPQEGPASEAVRELFRLELSGTEVASKRRFAALDEFAAEDDDRVRRTVVSVLDAALDRIGGGRMVGYEELGDAMPVKDWWPATTEEALEHFRAALRRLSSIRNAHPEIAEAAEQAVAGHMRHLMVPGLLEDVTAFVTEVRTDRGFWGEAAKGVGDWLYFDRDDPTSDLAVAVRRLYDELLPTDPVDRALLYCQFWPAEIRNPDLVYRSDKATIDYQYAARQAALLAPVIAAEAETVDRAILAMASQDVRNASPFTDALAPFISRPKEIFATAIAVSDANEGMGLAFIQSLLRSLDRLNPALGPELEVMAAGSKTFEKREISIYSALALNEDRLMTVAERISAGVIDPQQAVPLSYGQGMDPFPVPVIRPVIDALVARAAEGGIWAAIEMLSMYTHGRADFEPDLYGLIKDVLTAPLGEENRGGAMSAHSYGTLVSLLSRAGQIDDAFARSFARQVIVQLGSRSSTARSPTSEAMREALETIVKIAPLAIWGPLSAFYEVATPAERARLSGLVRKRSPFGEAASTFGEGILFAVPLDVLLDWAAEAPESRVEFLVSFFPIIEADVDPPSWHPATVELANRFGETKAFRSALVDRISPSSWSGSLQPYLEPFLEPLESWRGHPHLGDWSEDTLEMLTRRLKADAEMEASMRR